MNFPFASIRNRILALFLLSTITFVGALLYGVMQFQVIGKGIDSINNCYLPLSVETALKIDGRMVQLNKEFDRVSREGPMALRPANAQLYLESLQNDIPIIQTNLQKQIKQTPNEVETLTKLDEVLEKALKHVVEQQGAVQQWQTGSKDLAQNLFNQSHILLVKETRSINKIIEDRTIELGEQNAIAKEQTYLIGGVLAILAILLSVSLTWVALKTLQPIQGLTTQVQRLGHGDYTERVLELPDSAGLEVAVLAREINAMADAVAERDHRLSERAKALDALLMRLQQVINTIKAGVMVTEKDQITMINPAATEQWKREPKSQLPSALNVFNVGRYEEVEIDDMLFDIDITPFGIDGKLIVIEEVTQRVKDRERLGRTKRLAIVGRMLAQITHEVRNPLNAMSLNTEMLADEPLSKEAQEMLGIIAREIHRLEKLTERYLNLSRRRQIEKIEMSPRTIIEDLVQTYKHSLPVTLRVDTENDTAPFLIDEDGLRRTMQNLIRNAVEAGADVVEIKIRYHRHEVKISVQDNGEGMEKQQVEQLFSPFYTTKAKGTGLGLVISRQEIEEAGGSLTCTSEKGQGTTFLLTLPIEYDILSKSEIMS